MTRSQFTHLDSRKTLVPREILAQKPRTVAAALLLVLAGVLGSIALTQAAFAADPAPAAESGVLTAKVNINSADAQTLAQNLKGVGESRAEEIIRHRETYGPFATVEELTEVKGIGQSTLDRNRDLITLE